MTRTRLDWPKRPRKTWDRCFGAERLTWKCKSDPGYQISICTLDYCLVFPLWAEKMPERFRTLKAAMKAAQLHRETAE